MALDLLCSIAPYVLSTQYWGDNFVSDSPDHLGDEVVSLAVTTHWYDSLIDRVAPGR